MVIFDQFIIQFNSTNLKKNLEYLYISVIITDIKNKIILTTKKNNF